MTTRSGNAEFAVTLNDAAPWTATQVEVSHLADLWQRLGDVLLFAPKGRKMGAAELGLGFSVVYDASCVIVEHFVFDAPVTISHQEFHDLGDYWRHLQVETGNG